MKAPIPFFSRNFSKATSSVWEKNSDDENGESYVLILNSSNTQLDENGNLSTDFDGRVFYITDDSGERVPVYAIQTEQTDDYSEYITYVMKGDLGSEDLKKLWIHIRVSDEYVELGVLGGGGGGGDVFCDRGWGGTSRCATVC